MLSLGIHQRLKGHLLNELHVSFKLAYCFCNKRHVTFVKRQVIFLVNCNSLCFKGNAQFVQIVTFEPLMDFK